MHRLHVIFALIWHQQSRNQKIYLKMPLLLFFNYNVNLVLLFLFCFPQTSKGFTVKTPPIFCCIRNYNQLTSVWLQFLHAHKHTHTHTHAHLLAQIVVTLYSLWLNSTHRSICQIGKEGWVGVGGGGCKHKTVRSGMGSLTVSQGNFSFCQTSLSAAAEIFTQQNYPHPTTPHTPALCSWMFTKKKRLNSFRCPDGGAESEMAQITRYEAPHGFGS